MVGGVRSLIPAGRSALGRREIQVQHAVLHLASRSVQLFQGSVSGSGKVRIRIRRLVSPPAWPQDEQEVGSSC